MKILIIGAAGMIGRKLAVAIAAQNKLGGGVEELVLADIIETPVIDGSAVRQSSIALDMVAPGAAEKLIASRPDIIFHLAAIVSGEAEADFEKGYRVNFDGARALFEAIREEGAGKPYRPRMLYASSIAVFGAPFPESVPDEFLAAPLSSYGTQKAIVELLLADYIRRGFFDGITLRLPTICIRPGKPNKAASGFYSSILREPLVGLEAVLPVPKTLCHWFASPRSAVGFLLHAAKLDLSQLGARRALNMPGVSATVEEEIEALGRAAGDDAVALVREEPNDAVLNLVGGWPRKFSPARAEALGFTAEKTMDEIIAVHRQDELGR